MSYWIRVMKVITVLFLVGLAGSSAPPSPAQSDWQQSSRGLSVFRNDDRHTAGLAFVVEARNWPTLSLQGGVREAYGSLSGPTGIALGSVKIADVGAATLASETVDWAHNELSFESNSSPQLRLWVSRLSPAILIESPANALRLLSGNLAGSVMENGRVVPRAPAPTYPKYVAYSNGGSVQIRSLATPQSLPTLDGNWLLLWYGDNSHFVDTKAPLTYSGAESETASLPQRYAYQADAPLLLVFEKRPTRIQYSSEGGIDVSFAGPAGATALLPLFGRNHLRAEDTEQWVQRLPASVQQTAQWWASHLCSYPASATETYRYEASPSAAIVQESISFVHICQGSLFAPLPPTLALAKDALDVVFSGAIVDSQLATEFGPYLGIENVSDYTWRVANLDRYTGSRQVGSPDSAPPDLEQELVTQVDKIISAGHLAPWLFTDSVPVLDYHGDIYWLNPGDVIYHLAEVASVLPSGQKQRLIDYIRSERAAYPPEDVANLPLDVGASRGPYAVLGPATFKRWQTLRPDVFLPRVPLYNLLALSRYYELTGDPVSPQVWQKARDLLAQACQEQDWATLYWFQGFAERPVAVVNANRYFAGLVGYIKLAKLVGDDSEADVGRGLLARAAVLRLALARYPRYLYSANLIELPPEPDWQPRYTAGKWFGHIYNYDWRGPYDDARQVSQMSQFGVDLADHSGYGPYAANGGLATTFSPSLIAYRDMTPELARLLTDHAQADAAIYLTKVEANIPDWYMAFSEGVLGAEHNLNHPIDSFQLFLAKAWLEPEPPERLARYASIPWLETGDLFYLQKLAETMKAYRGVTWSDTR